MRSLASLGRLSPYFANGKITGFSKVFLNKNHPVSQKDVTFCFTWFFVGVTRSFLWLLWQQNRCFIGSALRRISHITTPIYFLICLRSASTIKSDGVILLACPSRSDRAAICARTRPRLNAFFALASLILRWHAALLFCHFRNKGAKLILRRFKALKKLYRKNVFLID